MLQEKIVMTNILIGREYLIVIAVSLGKTNQLRNT
jgi:hypothetical protein